MMRPGKKTLAILDYAVANIVVSQMRHEGASGPEDVDWNEVRRVALRLIDDAGYGEKLRGAVVSVVGRRLGALMVGEIDLERFILKAGALVIVDER